jgi:hypothetical protein
MTAAQLATGESQVQPNRMVIWVHKIRGHVTSHRLRPPTITKAIKRINVLHIFSLVCAALQSWEGQLAGRNVTRRRQRWMTARIFNRTSAARHVRAGVRIERCEEERENIVGLAARAFFWSVGRRVAMISSIADDPRPVWRGSRSHCSTAFDDISGYASKIATISIDLGSTITI